LKFLELSNQLVFFQSQALAALAERGLLNLEDLSDEEAMGDERPGDPVPKRSTFRLGQGETFL
jgi:hypothetical protein